jgi:hypothetical protein
VTYAINGIRVFAAVSVAALLTACGSSGSPGGAAPSQAAQGAVAPAATSTALPPAGTLPPGALPSGRISMAKAESVYQTIIEPGTALADVVARASNGPYPQFQTAMLAYASELRSEIAEFSKVHWPARVQPHITAMIRQDFPAYIGCLQAQASAGSAKAAQQVANTSHDCMVADNAVIPNSLQEMLSSSG